jgi:SAM-dependent methyltransferase
MCESSALLDYEQGRAHVKVECPRLSAEPFKVQRDNILGMVKTEFDAAEVHSVLGEAERLANTPDRESLARHLWGHAEHLRRYFTSFKVDNAPTGLSEQYVNDGLARFLRTVEFIPVPVGERILEIGSNPYFFHILLHKLFPGADIRGANFFDKNVFSCEVGSLRQRTHSDSFQEEFEFFSTLFSLETLSTYPFADGFFDLVFFCETLEHLAVDPLSTFSRLRRILKRGGHLIITLPNAVRLTSFALMLEGMNFFDIYSVNGINGRHNREYTLSELTNLLVSDGYQIVRAETWDRFDYDQIDIWSADYAGRSVKINRRKSELMKILESASAKISDRGDNLYVLARNPA